MQTCSQHARIMIDSSPGDYTFARLKSIIRSATTYWILTEQQQSDEMVQMHIKQTSSAPSVRCQLGHQKALSLDASSSADPEDKQSNSLRNVNNRNSSSSSSSNLSPEGITHVANAGRGASLSPSSFARLALVAAGFSFVAGWADTLAVIHFNTFAGLLTGSKKW